jgi:hypothetical protein
MPGGSKKKYGVMTVMTQRKQHEKTEISLSSLVIANMEGIESFFERFVSTEVSTHELE